MTLAEKKYFPQMLHLKHLSPACTISCLFNQAVLIKQEPQLTKVGAHLMVFLHSGDHMLAQVWSWSRNLLHLPTYFFHLFLFWTESPNIVIYIPIYLAINLKHAFSCVQSDCLPSRRQSHTDCICLAFLHCVFSNGSSKHLGQSMCSHLSHFSPLCDFKRVPKSPACEDA